MEALSDVDRRVLTGRDREVAPAARFADFYERTRDDIYRTVLLGTRHPERAEDAVHEAFARALADWSRLSSHPNPAAWVCRVALNQATSWWRVWRRETADPPDVPGPASEEPMDELIVGLVWRLPRRQREVVGLRILMDQSVDETARVLGIAPGTVKVHLHRALTQLRDRLTEAGIDLRY